MTLREKLIAEGVIVPLAARHGKRVLPIAGGTALRPWDPVEFLEDPKEVLRRRVEHVMQRDDSRARLA